MDIFQNTFEIVSQYRVLRCRACRFAVAPGSLSIHLRDQHRALPQKQRQAICVYAYGLHDVAEIPAEVIYPHLSEHPVPGFPYYRDGFRCDLDNGRGQLCSYICRSRQGIQQHCKDQHQWTNPRKRGRHTTLRSGELVEVPWSCNIACQTFFQQPGWLQYFQVTIPEATAPSDQAGEEGDDFFARQVQDIEQTQYDTIEAANVTEGFEQHRSTVVPWLRTTGIAQHVHGLRKDQIRLAVSVPHEDDDPILHIITQAMQQVLRIAHGWCFDGPKCMLNRPCRFALSRFQGPSGETGGKQRVFDPNKEPPSLKKYFAIGSRLLAYLYRITREDQPCFDVDDESQGPERVVELTVGQQRAWQHVLDLARQQQSDLDRSSIGEDSAYSDDDDDDLRQETSEVRDREQSLQDALVNLWMLLICHDCAAQRYRSPLVSFCAMLSVKPTTGGWMKPGNYSSDLSKIIWLVQLIIFYHSAQEEKRGQGRTLTLIQECCEVYLQQAGETPMAEILRWRLLLFHVRDHTVSDQEAVWDDQEDAVIYKDVTLKMEHVPTLLQAEYRRCQRILYKELMLDTSHASPMSALRLSDQGSNDRVDWSFKDCPENGAVLQDADRFLLSTIQRSKPLQRLFIDDSPQAETGRLWRESAMAAYERHVQDFLAALCVLIHISSGQPIREPEFFSMMWRNTQRRRHITIRFSRVMIHTNYGKQQSQQGLYQDSVRFLAQPIGDLLLDYLVYVLPLRTRFLRQASPGQLPSPLLWEHRGKVWPDSRLSAHLAAACVRARIPRLHVQNWRQITVAIVKTKFAGDSNCFDTGGADPDDEEIEEDIQAMTAQRNHRTRTVNRAYANNAPSSTTFANLYDGLIRKGLRASQLWQAFWGVDVIFASHKRKSTADGEPQMMKRLEKGIYRPRRPWSSGPLLNELRRLYHNPNLQWKSREQERALVATMMWQEQIVAILPTGGGKSALFMLPCMLPEAGVTVVIVPRVALRSDLLRRVRELGIHYLEWTPEEQRHAQLVFVSVEAASQKGFLGYARRLIDDQRLDRIVIDECHLTITAADYRDSMVRLSQIRSLRTQFVYLTATLPPSMHAEFEERNHLYYPTIIRASTNRSNIRYTVHQVLSSQGSLLEFVAEDLWTFWDEIATGVQDKAVMYVRSRQEAYSLAGLLRCDVYIGGDSLSDIEKASFLQQWTSDPQRPFLVATTALAEGFDYPHVRVAAIVDEPQDLMVLTQETGRAGRDGKKAFAVVYLPATWCPSPSSPDLPVIPSSLHDRSLWEQHNRLAVHRFLRGDQCRRTILSETLDAPQHRRWCMRGDLACDVCQQVHDEVIPPLLKPERTGEMQHTGLDIIQQQQLRAQDELHHYQHDLAAVVGTCLRCRAEGQPFHHQFQSCRRRMEVIEQKGKSIGRWKGRGRGRKGWLAGFAACFWCLNPQAICARADRSQKEGGEEVGCEWADTVLPLCFGIWASVDGRGWLREHFQREFVDVEAYFDWIGEATQFGGGRAVQGVRVAARRLGMYSGEWIF